MPVFVSSHPCMKWAFLLTSLNSSSPSSSFSRSSSTSSSSCYLSTSLLLRHENGVSPETLRRKWPQIAKCRQTRRRKCKFTISICSSQCNYSKKRQQFYRLVSFAQNTDVHTSGKTAKLHYWPKKGRQLLLQWITLFLSLYQDYHHLPAAARLLHQDRRISQTFRWIAKINRSNDDSTCQARMRETDANKPSQAGLGKPWCSTNRRRDGQGRSNARHSWLVTALHRKSWGPGGACARTFFWKRDARLGRWCLRSGDTKTEAQY